MKTNIHPKFYPDAQVVCSCGNTFTTGSTKQKLQADVCYKCHPLYTGEQRFLDTKGRVDTFQKKQEVENNTKNQLLIENKKKTVKKNYKQKL